jgi:hypothetical protein
LHEKGAAFLARRLFPLEHLMILRLRKLSHAYLLLACFAASPVLAQASASVATGPLRGDAQVGPSNQPPNTRVARGPRTDDTRNCDSRGVTVNSANGSASASVTTSPGGSSAVAGGGSPGSRTEYFGCDADHHRSEK